MVFGLRKSVFQRNSLISFAFLIRKSIYKSSRCVIITVAWVILRYMIK